MTERYNVTLDPGLVARIDAAAGPRGRSAFLARAAEYALSASEALSRPVDLETSIGRPPAPQPRRKERAPVKRPSRVAFDPSRFNQATSLR